MTYIRKVKKRAKKARSHGRKAIKRSRRRMSKVRKILLR